MEGLNISEENGEKMGILEETVQTLLRMQLNPLPEVRFWDDDNDLFINELAKVMVDMELEGPSFRSYVSSVTVVGP